MTCSRFLFLLLAAAISITACISPEARRDRRLSEAEAAMARGDLWRATEILQLAQAYDPRDPVVATRLARLYEERGDFNRARRVVEEFPGNVEEPSWLNLRARALFRYGRYKQAARIAVALEEVSEAETATVEAISDIVVERRLEPKGSGTLPSSWRPELVERLLDGGYVVSALAWMEQIPADDPARARLLEPFMEHARCSTDLALVRRVWALVEPADTGNETLVERQLLSLDGDSTAVARLDARFLARYPDHPKRRKVLLAEARRRLTRGERDEALRILDEALTLDGGDVSALVLKGLVLQWSGRNEEAERVLRTALAFDPGNQKAREALQSMQEQPEAVIMRIETLPP